jgi:hypothetical protein
MAMSAGPDLVRDVGSVVLVCFDAGWMAVRVVLE